MSSAARPVWGPGRLATNPMASAERRKRGVRCCAFETPGEKAQDAVEMAGAGRPRATAGQGRDLAKKARKVPSREDERTRWGRRK